MWRRVSAVVIATGCVFWSSGCQSPWGLFDGSWINRAPSGQSEPDLVFAEGEPPADPGAIGSEISRESGQ